MNTKNFEAIEHDAKDSPVKDIKWYGREDQTGESLMHDTGKGEAIVIRQFEFKLNPSLTELPTTEQILTPEYLKDLNIQLWADGLRLVMKPRVFIDTETCRVFAPCQPRTGSTILEEPKLLQEWIQ